MNHSPLENIFLINMGVEDTTSLIFGGRSQESNLPRTAGGPNWI